MCQRKISPTLIWARSSCSWSSLAWVPLPQPWTPHNDVFVHVRRFPQWIDFGRFAQPSCRKESSCLVQKLDCTRRLIILTGAAGGTADSGIAGGMLAISACFGRFRSASTRGGQHSTTTGAHWADCLRFCDNPCLTCRRVGTRDATPTGHVVHHGEGCRTHEQPNRCRSSELDRIRERR